MELGDGARLLCVFVVFCTVIYNFVDAAGVSWSCVPRLVGVVSGCSRRRLLAGFPRRSYWACGAAGRSVMLGLFIIVVSNSVVVVIVCFLEFSCVPDKEQWILGLEHGYTHAPCQSARAICGVVVGCGAGMCEGMPMV